MFILNAAFLKRLTDIAIILAVSAAIAFVIIASGNSLVAKANVMRSYYMWWSFVTRPDIVVTTILAVIVTMAVSHFNSSGRR